LNCGKNMASRKLINWCLLVRYRADDGRPALPSDVCNDRDVPCMFEHTKYGVYSIIQSSVVVIFHKFTAPTLGQRRLESLNYQRRSTSGFFASRKMALFAYVLLSVCAIQILEPATACYRECVLHPSGDKDLRKHWPCHSNCYELKRC